MEYLFDEIKHQHWNQFNDLVCVRTVTIKALLIRYNILVDFDKTTTIVKHFCRFTALYYVTSQHGRMFFQAKEVF